LCIEVIYLENQRDNKQVKNYVFKEIYIYMSWYF